MSRPDSELRLRSELLALSRRERALVRAALVPHEYRAFDSLLEQEPVGEVDFASLVELSPWLIERIRQAAETDESSPMTPAARRALLCLARSMPKGAGQEPQQRRKRPAALGRIAFAFERGRRRA